MDRSHHSQHSTALGRLRRLAIVVAGAAVFLGVASIIKPQPQQASATPEPGPVEPSKLETKAGRHALPQHPQEWKCLGFIEGREYVVIAFASPEGPRYTVKSREGAVLQRDLPANEVYRAFPDIDLENLRVDPPEGDLLMLHSGTLED